MCICTLSLYNNQNKQPSNRFKMTDALLPPRHRLADLPRRPVLRALLHHDSVHHCQQQRLPASAGGDLLLLVLLAGLDRAAAAGLEQVRPRGSRDHLLGGLEDPDAQQHLLHRLPVHILPAPAILCHPLLLQQTSAHHQAGELSIPCPHSRSAHRWKIPILLLGDGWIRATN